MRVRFGWAGAGKALFAAAGLAAAILLVPACGGGGSSGGGGGAPPPPVSWSTQVWPIIAANCQTCHTVGIGSMQVPTMIMIDAAATRTAWVGIDAACAGLPVGTKRVVAGDALNSFVHQKISQSPPPCGAQMPFGMAPLPAGNQMTIFDWIEQGALDN